MLIFLEWINSRMQRNHLISFSVYSLFLRSRVGRINPCFSYNRSVWAVVPTSFAATPMVYRGASLSLSTSRLSATIFFRILLGTLPYYQYRHLVCNKEQAHDY